MTFPFNHALEGKDMNRVLTAFVPAALLVMSMVVAPATASAADDDPVAALQRMFDAQNRKDLNGVLAVMSDDVVQIGGACNFAPNPQHRCDGKQAFVKVFGPPDQWVVLRFVGTPRVAGDMATGMVEARFENLPPVFKALNVEHVVDTFTVHVRNGQLYNILFADDPNPIDAQTIAFNALSSAMPAKDGRMIFDETPSTQILFAGTWGSRAAVQWGTEHDAELNRPRK